jgi:hypothetical protein
MVSWEDGFRENGDGDGVCDAGFLAGKNQAPRFPRKLPNAPTTRAGGSSTTYLNVF